MILLKRKKNKRIAERKTETKINTLIPWNIIGIGAMLWIITLFIFIGDKFAPSIDLAENQKAPETIISSVSFDCINLKITEAEKNSAAEKVPFVFEKENTKLDIANQKINSLLTRLNQFYKSSNTNNQTEAFQSINDIIIGSNLNASDIIDAFSENKLKLLQQNLTKNINNFYIKGIISNEDYETYYNDKKNNLIDIFDDTKNTNSIVNIDNIFSEDIALSSLIDEFNNDGQKRVIENLSSIIILPNLKYNNILTESNKSEAKNKVELTYDKFPKEFVIVKESDLVTKQTIELLKAHNKQLSLEVDPSEVRLMYFGKSILLLAGLIASIVMLKLLDSDILQKIENVILLSLLALITVSSARLLSYLSIQLDLLPSVVLVYLVPHSLAVLLSVILFGGGAALSIGFWGSFATAIYFDQSFNVFVLGILTTVTATTAARNVHRRSNIYRAGLLIALVNFLFTFIIYIFDQQEITVLGIQLLGALISSIFSASLTLVLIPLFEKLFGITTDITLLELSDMSHPLLQKMAIQAPGTYHHSLMVATLSQNAAEAINANSLLVRVSAYYHDIGKLAKPEFFSENIQNNENPHDNLSPHMSALVIIAHVKEGLALAKRHKLPTPILDAIEQHHGNGLIHFFYEKAKRNILDLNSDEELNEADFRYGGKPAESPEMAILSLADACEAASRSINKPTPQKISNLINEIFEQKLNDGQLDYARLNMAEINLVKKSIIFSLTNMLHGRVPYKNNENSSDK